MQKIRSQRKICVSVNDALVSRSSFNITGRRCTPWTTHNDIIQLFVFTYPDGRTTGIGGLPRLSQPQLQPTHQRPQDQGNGERQHSVPHSEWTTGAAGYVPVPWSLNTEDGKRTTEFRTRLNKGQAIGASYCEKYGSVTANLQQRCD